MEGNEIGRLISIVQNLESHIVNLIIPVQSLDKINELAKDCERASESLVNSCKHVKKNVDSSFSSMNGHLERIADSVARMDITRAFSEIRYIGKRLRAIEDQLSTVLKCVNKEEVQLCISLNKTKVYPFPHEDLIHTSEEAGRKILLGNKKSKKRKQ